MLLVLIGLVVGTVLTVLFIDKLKPKVIAAYNALKDALKKD